MTKQELSCVRKEQKKLKEGKETIYIWKLDSFLNVSPYRFEEAV